MGDGSRKDCGRRQRQSGAEQAQPAALAAPPPGLAAPAVEGPAAASAAKPSGSVSTQAFVMYAALGFGVTFAAILLGVAIYWVVRCEHSFSLFSAPCKKKPAAAVGVLRCSCSRLLCALPSADGDVSGGRACHP